MAGGRGSGGIFNQLKHIKNVPPQSVYIQNLTPVYGPKNKCTPSPPPTHKH